MITLKRLTAKFFLVPEFVELLQRQGSQFHDNIDFAPDQAARILCLHDIYKVWPSISRHDLLRTFKSLERAFKDPPMMTYDYCLSASLRFQILPRRYLTQIELAIAEVK